MEELAGEHMLILHTQNPFPGNALDRCPDDTS